MVGEWGDPYIPRAETGSTHATRRARMDWFYVYFVGFLILIAAIGMGLDRLGVSAAWIFIVCLALFGVAVMSAVKRTRGAGPDGDGG
ncbi:MAG TPA: hypothetical protein VFG78_04925 [Gemmatimonadota bacterium]|nr:hypothetical protein [Gemmatimonadota bacterium]